MQRQLYCYLQLPSWCSIVDRLYVVAYYQYSERAMWYRACTLLMIFPPGVDDGEKQAVIHLWLDVLIQQTDCDNHRPPDTWRTLWLFIFRSDTPYRDNQGPLMNPRPTPVCINLATSMHWSSIRLASPPACQHASRYRKILSDITSSDIVRYCQISHRHIP